MIGYAAMLVAPWMIGAWLLYRAFGTIWPLIIGHALLRRRHAHRRALAKPGPSCPQEQCPVH